jgi:hypothetical protein
MINIENPNAKHIIIDLIREQKNVLELTDQIIPPNAKLLNNILDKYKVSCTTEQIINILYILNHPQYYPIKA